MFPLLILNCLGATDGNRPSAPPIDPDQLPSRPRVCQAFRPQPAMVTDTSAINRRHHCLADDEEVWLFGSAPRSSRPISLV
jgi:hypothetical protein